MNKLLIMENINKSFFGVKVLNDVNIGLNSGEVHVLLGENGAGKSTLIKILSGAYNLDSGRIFIDGKEINMESYGPKKAADYGIATIYQDFHLIPHLSIAENMFLSDLHTRFGLIKWKTIFTKAKEFMEKINFPLNPNLKVKELNVSQKQMLEIAIALSKNVKIIIMDEPTAAISKNEVDELFELINKIKKRGVGIIYISHKLQEIKQIGDHITVLRDGTNVGTLEAKDADLKKIVKLMSGKEILGKKRNKIFLKTKTFVEFKNLSIPGSFEKISFKVYKGEILGLTGLVGSGKTELARAIFGVDRLWKGDIYIDNKQINIKLPKNAVEYGFGYLPEDRDVHGLCLNMGVKDNMSLVFLSKLKKFLFSNSKEKLLVNDYVKYLNIKTSNISQQVKYLSGGNKQKVVFAKWLVANCKFLMLDEPTMGIDIGAKEEIYNLIYNFVKNGNNSVIFISSDVDEILNISDRILVMSNGHIINELNPIKTTKQEIMEYCLSVK